MNPYSLHLWHDPWLNRCVIVIAHLLDGFPMPPHREVVDVCLKRYGAKLIYYRNLAGEWCELTHDGRNFVSVADIVATRKLEALKKDFPVTVS